MPDLDLDLDAYLARIGVRGPCPPTFDTLSRLVAAHAAAIPFENLDPLLGRPVSLDPAAIGRKLVHEGRGGYCLEHNLLFAAVLRALGFAPTCLAARVLWNQPDPAQAPRTHLLLQVEAEGRPRLVDVGFGGLTLTAALTLEDGAEQPTSHEPFRLQHADGKWCLQARIRQEWRALYRFDLEPQLPPDLEMMNHFVASHPRSIFVGNLMCARALPERRLALLNRQYSVHWRDGRSETRILADADELCTVLESDFGLRLPADEAGLRQRLGALPAGRQ